ncbi:MAG TPA: SEC-C metal-binding domain-containing protein [Casimicrobiaceae bacterium]|nr:SEC-C metal-binding domain-containing protein [Casimicrobiaceae bacterium]
MSAALAPPASRNAPCPCGSGKRYKDCHGALTATAMGWVQRALAQMQTRDYVAAEASFREAAKLAPDDARIHADIATLCILQNRHDDAEAPLVRALALEPEHPYALCLYTHIRQRHCAWNGLADLHARVSRALDRGVDPRYQFSVFPILSMPTTPQQQRVAAQWTASMFAPPTPAPRPRVTLQPGERLRVAFVTANFRDHPTLHLSLEFWERIDRSRLEMFAYSLRHDDDNPFLRRARAAFEHFTDVSQDSVAGIAQRIRDDRIAILIDRNGYTLHAREAIFALRPAPIQINCIGFPGTLGTSWYDYIFTDRFSLPEHLTPFYTERPLYMPHMAFPSDTTRLPSGPPPARSACGLPEQGFVFCCFNNTYKILPDVFAVWMRLLAAVPGSVLWLLETSAEAKANLRREAGAAGIDPARLIFAARVKVGAHVARHAGADLFLDTYPYGAHTTANDALLAGLPVLTCAGDTLVSRICGSQLSAIGLPELITTTFADYEALALKLAQDPALLQSYRDRLVANRRTTPLFDMARYARDFEEAMQRVWAEHCVER